VVLDGAPVPQIEREDHQRDPLARVLRLGQAGGLGDGYFDVGDKSSGCRSSGATASVLQATGCVEERGEMGASSP